MFVATRNCDFFGNVTKYEDISRKRLAPTAYNLVNARDTISINATYYVLTALNSRHLDDAEITLAANESRKLLPDL